LKKTNDSFGRKGLNYYFMDRGIFAKNPRHSRAGMTPKTPRWLIYYLGLAKMERIIYFAMKWHDVLKESSSPDSFKEIFLCVLCVSSAAGGEIIRPFQEWYLSRLQGI